MATADSAVSCDAFLVFNRDLQIRSRTASVPGQATNYLVDQLENPETAVLSLGGDWKGQAVMSGTFGTASDSKYSLALVKSFEKIIRKHFKKVKAYWVGPKAFEQLNKGVRLTIALQSPRDFDLTLN